LIAEGEKTEKQFFKNIGKLYLNKGSVLHIFSYKTHIFTLYKKIKEARETFTETIRTLREIAKNDPDIEILNNKFAYIYLVFDFERHDPNFGYDKLFDMIKLFNDETEKGKLYINYPMVESYKDHSKFDEDDYCLRDCAVCNGHNYKRQVNLRGYQKRLKDYKKEDFNGICRLNLIKTSRLSDGRQGLLDYEKYGLFAQQEKILSAVKEYIESKDTIPILNTSIFFLTDYFGKTFFNEIMSEK
jgi:hypothetical protein